jgi:hypothetical protein
MKTNEPYINNKLIFRTTLDHTIFLNKYNGKVFKIKGKLNQLFRDWFFSDNKKQCSIDDVAFSKLLELKILNQ